MASLETDRQVKELGHRRGDKLDVTLWWVKGTLDSYVEVIDYKQEPPATSTIPVPPGASPNDVFNHPFRYFDEYPTVELPVQDGRGAE